MQLYDEYGHVNPAQIKVVEVKAMGDYRLWLRFNTGEEKIFDFKALLSYPAFKPLADPEVFNNVGLDHGVVIWEDGKIDIDPSCLYDHAI